MYGKIFDSMYEGTLYGHWEAIVTLQQMIVLCDAGGVVDMTPQAIAARTSIPLEIILKGIETLSKPDPYTRTPGEDGRRITLLDDHRPWGWRLVNHAKYRALRDMDGKREADRQRIAEKRRKNNDVATTSRDVADVAHADADADAKARKSTRAARAVTPGEFAVSAAVREWAKRKGFASYLDLHLEYFLDYIAQPKNRNRYQDLDAAFRNCVRGDWGDIRRQAQAAERRGERIATAEEWWKTDEGIKARGAQRGIAVEGRPFVKFKAMVFADAGEGPWIDERDGTVYRLVQEIRRNSGAPA